VGDPTGEGGALWSINNDMPSMTSRWSREELGGISQASWTLRVVVGQENWRTGVSTVGERNRSDYGQT